jgi:hypothetical protein
MQKVLIISYFFPPCNLTAAQRVGSWEKYLPEHGFYPIVITRNWAGNELNEKSRLENSGYEEKIVKKNNSKIYFLPYKQSIRDWFFVRTQNNILFTLVSKMLTFFLLLTQNFFVRRIPYHNLYFKAKEILKKNPDIQYLIISGNPFEQFVFGYLLKKEFSYIKMIADYRDDWTTSELFIPKNFIEKIINYLNKKHERKWISTYNIITSISDEYVHRLEKFVGVKGDVLLNGYDFDDIVLKKNKPKENEFVINYIGSLYNSQPIEVFLDAIKEVIRKYASIINIKLQFIGLNDNENQAKRVKNSLKGFEENFEITNRIPREEAIDIQLNADILLMLSHTNIKGVPSSKLYEYIGLNKPILLFPCDNDIIFETLKDTNLGYVVNNKNEIIGCLERLIQEKLEKKEILVYPKNIAFYSRKHQTKKLAEILQKLK